MRVVTLIPLSKKGKQIVQKHGDRWEVVDRKDTVLFTTNSGPFLLVLPLTEERAPAMTAAEAKLDSASRWIHEFTDANFKVAP